MGKRLRKQISIMFKPETAEKLNDLIEHLGCVRSRLLETLLGKWVFLVNELLELQKDFDVKISVKVSLTSKSKKKRKYPKIGYTHEQVSELVQQFLDEYFVNIEHTAKQEYIHEVEPQLTPLKKPLDKETLKVMLEQDLDVNTLPAVNEQKK